MADTSTPAREGLPELPAKVWRNTCTCHPETCCCAEYKVKLNGAFLIAGTRQACETVVAAINATALAAIAGREAQKVVAHGYYCPLTGAYAETQRTPRWLPAVVCAAISHPQPEKGCVDCGGTGKGLDVGYYEPGPCPKCAPPPPSDAAQGDEVGFGKLPECPPELESPPMTEEERTAAINRFKEKLLAAETEAPPSQPVRVDEAFLVALMNAVESYEADREKFVAPKDKKIHREQVALLRQFFADHWPEPAAHKGEEMADHIEVLQDILETTPDMRPQDRAAIEASIAALSAREGGEAVAEVCRPGHPRKDSATFVRMLRENIPDGSLLYLHPAQPASQQGEEIVKLCHDGEPCPKVYGQQAHPTGDRVRVENIALVAHHGGLAGMSEADALNTIRRLTLPYFDKSATPEQARQKLAAALDQEKNDGRR